MIDVHCHLNFHSFKNDYDEVIKNAFARGVIKIINTGTKIDSSQNAVDLAEKYPNLYAIVGVHPHHADKHEENWEESLNKLAKHPKVVGIGECGMDFYNYKSNGITDPAHQKEIFEKQIEIAYNNKLPLQIHNRQAGKEILEILDHHKNSLQTIPGMFHCFAGNPQILKQALDLGFYIGFDGNSTYKGLAPGEDTELSTLIKLTPLDRIVTETDSPFLTPEPHRGKRNEPKYVILVGEYIAKIKGETFAQINIQTTENALKVFPKMK